jgi:hypothetical protein
VIGLRLRLQLGNRFCITLSAFPNLEHGWDTGCTHPGEGGGLSGSLWTVHGQAVYCSHQPVKERGGVACPQSSGQAADNPRTAINRPIHGSSLLG